MKSEKNKAPLIQYLCDADKTNPYVWLIVDNSAYNHEEADVKIISYLLESLPQKKNIQILADDTDIFVLHVFFIWLYKPNAQISMRKYNNKVTDINATAATLGNEYFDLLVVHALSGCDSVSYPYGKGKTSANNLMLKRNLDFKDFYRCRS